MHGNLQHSNLVETRDHSGTWGQERRILATDYDIPLVAPHTLFLDPGGSNRVVNLPIFDRGRWYIISHVGSANTLTVKDSNGATVITLSSGFGAIVVSSETEWITLAEGVASVFGASGASHAIGLVPDPGAVAGSSRFLREDGTWASVAAIGSYDGYTNVSDGTHTAVASGADTLRVRSSDSGIIVTVTNNDATYGDLLDLQVNEAAVDHNALLNYVANQHIDHTSVSIATAANSGLSGGGTIAANRSILLDINNLTADTPVLADSFAFYDASGGDTNKATLTTLNGILDHNALLNYSANRHIDHTAVSISAGIGLTGGGDISSSRSLSLDINGLSADTLASGDFFVFYDISGGDHNKVTLTNLNGSLNIASASDYATTVTTPLAGKVATTRAINSGSGLTGGGDLSADRTLALNVPGLTAGTSLAGADLLPYYDTVNSAHKKITFTNFQALFSSSVFDISSLTADTLATGDFIPFYDISGSDQNKITIANLNAFLSHDSLSGYDANKHVDHTGVTLTAGVGLTGGGTIAASRTFDLDLSDLTSDTPVLGDTFAFYDVSGSDTNKATLTVLNGILDHNALLNYDANKHVDHTAVSISPGVGLSGGGTLAATRTLTLDINGLTADATPDIAADYVATYDASASTSKKVLLQNLPTALEASNIDLWTGTATTKVLTPNRAVAGSAPVTISSGATITPDLNAGMNFVINTIATNFTLANPTNMVAGKSGVLVIIQDGTGSRLMSSVGSAWKFAGGNKTLSTAASSVDVIHYYVFSSSVIYATLNKAFA